MTLSYALNELNIFGMGFLTRPEMYLTIRTRFIFIEIADMTRHPERQSSIFNPSLRLLDFLVGEWKLVATHPDLPEAATGATSVQWLEGGAFLLVESNFEQPGPPNAKFVIGKDDSGDIYRVLYYDERGVSRIYKMSLDGTVWKMWRNAPGFSQRFTATLSEDGNTMVAFWEKSSDGKKWDNDLELTYSRIT